MKSAYTLNKRTNERYLTCCIATILNFKFGAGSGTGFLENRNQLSGIGDRGSGIKIINRSKARQGKQKCLKWRPSERARCVPERQAASVTRVCILARFVRRTNLERETARSLFFIVPVK